MFPLSFYLTEGLLTKDEYRGKLRQIQVQKEKLEEERATAETQVIRLVDWRQVRQDIKLLYNDIHFGLDNLDFGDKRKIVDLLIDRVVLFEDKVRIEGIIPSARPTNNRFVSDVIGPKLSV